MQGNIRSNRPPMPEYEEMRLRFNNVLDLLMPEAGHALTLLGDHGARDPEALRDTLINVVNEDLDDQGHFRLSHAVVLTALPGSPGVTVEHMLDEYWWVEIYPTRDAPTGVRPLVMAADPAVAILRVNESSDNLPVAYDRSPRVTPASSPIEAAQRAYVIRDFLLAV